MFWNPYFLPTNRFVYPVLFVPYGVDLFFAGRKLFRMGNPTISNFSSVGIGNAFFNFQSSLPRYIKPIPPHGMLKATLPVQWSENSQELPVQQVKAARSASEQQAVSEIYTEPEPQKREIHLSAAASLPLKKRKGNKKSKQVFKPSDFTANSLFDDDLEKIVVKYGSEIEDIYNLAPGQKWMFEKANKVSSDFFLQLMFKAVISIKPSELRQKIEEVCLKRDNLRSAYVYRDMSQPFRVVLKNRVLELRCEELSYQSEDELDARIKSIMEADRRRGFDLEKDSLLRIAIYKTGKDDTYAILVSQPHINTDGISMMLLIKDIFMDYALELSGIDMELETRSYKEYAKWLESKDTEKELLYWKELLVDAPIYTGISRIANSSLGQPQISELSRFFSDDVQDALRKKQSEFHATQNNLMQAAWGIMLMKLYGINDAVFGAITSGRDADVAGSSMIAGGFINALPVRAKIESDDTKIGTLVKEIQKQFLRSMEFSHVSPGEMEKALERKQPIFDHLLNFHNFMQTPSGGFSKQQSIPGIQLIESTMYDNLSTALTCYFVNENGKLGVRFTYDQNRLSSAKIRILMECFEKVVTQIALGNSNLTVREIDCPDLSVFDKAKETEEAEQKEIQAFIRSLGVLSPEHDSLIPQLAAASKIEVYEADDIIIREKEPIDDLLFVYDGFAELCKKGMDGWTKPLMMLKRGKLISAAALSESRSSLSEVRATNDMKVLSIPVDMLYGLMSYCPEIALKIIGELDRRANSFSVLWVNAN